MIDLTDLSLSAGQFVLGNVNLHLEDGQYGVLMGQSGCGKTSLLEAICGLRPIDAGTIRVNGSDVTRRRPAERGVGYVPQDGALFMTMPIDQQLAYALTIRRWRHREIQARINELARLLQIEHLLRRMPAQTQWWRGAARRDWQGNRLPAGRAAA